MTIPSLAPGNLLLRFALEIAALVGLAVGGWSLVDAPLSWLLAAALPLAGIVIWGVFNVPGDPSRSGRAPVSVPGSARLVLEVVVLLAGAAGLAVGGLGWLAVVMTALVALHYATTMARVRWLLAR